MPIQEHGSAALILPDGKSVLVRVRQSDRARTTRIVLGPERLPEIILAAGTPAEEAPSLLENRRDWLARKLNDARGLCGGTELGLELSTGLPLDGARLPLKIERGPRAAARRAPDGFLGVSGPDQEAMSSAIERWYRREARKLLNEMLEDEAERLGVDYRCLMVRDPRRRWGSCSTAGDISLSWRLVLMPASVRRYVIVHELLHVRVPSHSRAYWRLVEVANPGWQESAAWLRRHGAEVRRFGCHAALREAIPVPVSAAHSQRTLRERTAGRLHCG